VRRLLHHSDEDAYLNDKAMTDYLENNLFGKEDGEDGGQGDDKPKPPDLWPSDNPWLPKLNDTMFHLWTIATRPLVHPILLLRSLFSLFCLPQSLSFDFDLLFRSFSFNLLLHPLVNYSAQFANLVFLACVSYTFHFFLYLRVLFAFSFSSPAYALPLAHPFSFCFAFWD
jgi:hypothetical protein